MEQGNQVFSRSPFLPEQRDGVVFRSRGRLQHSSHPGPGVLQPLEVEKLPDAIHSAPACPEVRESQGLLVK